MLVLKSITTVFIVIFIIAILQQILADEKVKNHTMVGYIVIILVYVSSIVCMWP